MVPLLSQSLPVLSPRAFLFYRESLPDLHILLRWLQQYSRFLWIRLYQEKSFHLSLTTSMYYPYNILFRMFLHLLWHLWLPSSNHHFPFPLQSYNCQRNNLCHLPSEPLLTDHYRLLFLPLSLWSQTQPSPRHNTAPRSPHCTRQPL